MAVLNYVDMLSTVFISRFGKGIYRFTVTMNITCNNDCFSQLRMPYRNGVAKDIGNILCYLSLANNLNNSNTLLACSKLEPNIKIRIMSPCVTFLAQLLCLKLVLPQSCVL